MKRALLLIAFIPVCFYLSAFGALHARPFLILKTYTTLDDLAQDATRAIDEMASLDVRVVSFKNFEVSARAMDAMGAEWTLRLRTPRLTPPQAALLDRTDQAHVTFLITNVLPVQHLIEGTLYNITASTR